MSTPTRRRRQRSRTPELAIIAATALIVALLIHPSVLIWVAVTAAIAFAAYILGLSRGLDGRPAPRKPVSEFRQAKRAATRQTSLRAKSDAKASRNGWLPPANPQLTTLAVSRECAAGDCVACPGGTSSGGCQCTCGHDPAVIVARNEKAYDAAHPDDQPPF